MEFSSYITNAFRLTLKTERYFLRNSDLVNGVSKLEIKYFLRTFGYSGSNGASDNNENGFEGIDPLKMKINE